MASDRGAALIVQAASLGLIDFSKARLLDRKWWTKLKLLTDGLEQENNSRVLALRHAQHLAAISVPNLDETAFNSHWSGAGEALNKFTQVLLPWYGDINAQTAQTKTVGNMSDAWKRKWGDPSNPEVAKNIQAVADSMYRKQRETHAKLKDIKELVTAANKKNKKK